MFSVFRSSNLNTWPLVAFAFSEAMRASECMLRCGFRLLRMSTVMVVILGIIQVSLMFWSLYDWWSSTTSGQQVLWHTKPLRDCVFWSFTTSAAWYIKSAVWNCCLGLCKWVWSLLCPHLDTSMSRMQRSLHARGISTITWFQNGQQQLWQICDDQAWFDRDGIYEQHVNAKTGKVTHYRRMIGGLRGALPINDWEQTPPTSRHPTPPDMIAIETRIAIENGPLVEAIEDQPGLLCIEDVPARGWKRPSTQRSSSEPHRSRTMSPCRHRGVSR